MIGLADCNNFYASCERVFKPSIRNKPVIVLSNNDGCVIARSNESKLLGIKMGEPAFKIKGLIKKYNINVFSTNFALYGDFSNRVMEILKSEVKSIEVYSIDEAFLDFSDFINAERAISIREKVKRWTGIPISIGVAPTKTLAKVANHIAKKYTKNGVFILNNNNLQRILNIFPVEDLWGIGIKYAKKLNYAGIYTALQFRDLDTDWIKRNFSINGVRLQDELKGIKHYSIESVLPRKKTICTTRSFGQEIQDYMILKEAISNFANSCATKLRKEESCCSSISVFLTTNKFNTKTSQYCPSIDLYFSTPTNDSIEIVSKANYALKMIYKKNYLYKKAGVIVKNIISQEEVQMSLFDTVDRRKKRKLMCSVDRINMIMGRDKVYLASQGVQKRWAIKQQQLSPCYTTQFSDLLTVKI
ncbi:MAG: SOS mutagenesis and repair protein UmuC [Flavobacteriales bacterium]|nr:SOS mutagenesis and repair protein UmuC [Flavobacteriales bacterium]